MKSILEAVQQILKSTPNHRILVYSPDREKKLEVTTENLKKIESLDKKLIMSDVSFSELDMTWYIRTEEV